MNKLKRQRNARVYMFSEQQDEFLVAVWLDSSSSSFHAEIFCNGSSITIHEHASIVTLMEMVDKTIKDEAQLIRDARESA
jgi:hypothetical protein